jgi:6-pyruvoyltetrahydropterin/6-carboxytetrahydropterin synthase
VSEAMISCTRIIEFDAGHRVYKHESKCSNVHGHRYKVEIKAIRNFEKVDVLGRVIDFSVIKEKLGGWIDKFWDHGMLLFENDPIKEAWCEGHMADQKCYWLPLNPTAENLAYYLLMNICPRLFDELGIKVIEVVVWETPNCKATAHL